MTIPYINPLAWAMGTLEDRNAGGIMPRLWADLVFPYTWTSDVASEPWWDATVDHGLFEGWHRNFLEGAEGAPNYPTDRGFNITLVSVLGLKVSATAPRRIRWVPPDPPSTSLEHLWPLNRTNGALELVDYYMRTFSDTYVIIEIPEREVMNLLNHPGLDDSGTGVGAPSPSLGLAGITDFVQALLAAGYADRILGWYVFDEPDGDHRGAWGPIPPSDIKKVRDVVRTAEKAYRNANDPIFLDLKTSDDEKEFRLRPCLMSFTKLFHRFPSTTPFHPRDYHTQLSADQYMVDWYPYVRLPAEILTTDYRFCGGNVPPLVPPVTADIRASIEAFTDLRDQVNTDPAAPRVPVYAWIQGGGATFNLPGASPSAYTHPAPPPALPGCGTDPAKIRWARRPARVEVRYYTWATMRAGSEGMPCFSQTGIADASIVANYTPVARELEFFRNFRLTASSRQQYITPNLLDVPPRPRPAGWLPKAEVLFFEYHPPVPFEGEVKGGTWLLIMNHSSIAITPTFRFKGLHDGTRIREVQYLEFEGEDVILRTGGRGTFRVDPFRMRLFQVDPG